MSYDPGPPGQPPGGQGGPGGPGGPGGWPPPGPGGGFGPPPTPAGGFPPQQPGWGPPPGPPPAGYGGPPGISGSSEEGFNFFPALFDFGFTRFATFGLVKILYIIVTVLLGLGYVGFTIFSFSQDALTGLGVLIFGGIAALLYLAFFRLAFEFYFAVVRMSEDIHRRR